MSKWFLDVETRYLELEKLALALVVASKKLILSRILDQSLDKLPIMSSTPEA